MRTLDEIKQLLIDNKETLGKGGIADGLMDSVEGIDKQVENNENSGAKKYMIFYFEVKPLDETLKIGGFVQDVVLDFQSQRFNKNWEPIE